MRPKIAISIGALVVPFIGYTAARAQDKDSYLSSHELAPSHALELKAASGYTQGFGNVAPGRDLKQVAGAGIGVSADLDYRLSPAWSVGVEGQYQALSSADNTSARGMSANLGATYHLDPILRGDPWARLGTGYRWVWENDVGGVPGIKSLRHGFQLATAKVGYDVRVSKDVAIAPVIGADLNLFVWEDNTGSAAQRMSTAQVATFVYLGLQGRFDLGGKRSDDSVVVAVVAPPPQVIAPPPPVAAPAPVEETQPVSPSIAVSEDVMNECALHLNSIEKAPKFEFDKADLKSEDREVLRKIGECFTSGPLKGASMRLVGRADPRGSLEYNDGLGARRAGNVSGFLKEVGVDATKIEQESRGKRDARGIDEASWQVDRRVDVLKGQ